VKGGYCETTICFAWRIECCVSCPLDKVRKKLFRYGSGVRCVLYVHVPDVPLTAKKRGSGLVCVELQMPSNLAFAFVNFIPCREK
jgi:hypothetical protein